MRVLLGGDVLDEPAVRVMGALMLAERVDAGGQRFDGRCQRLTVEILVAGRERVEQYAAQLARHAGLPAYSDLEQLMAASQQMRAMRNSA